MITEDHILRYLPKVRLGALCIEVFIALTEIGNSTSLDVIMRGLLPPHEKTQIEKLAIDEAKTKSYNFIKDLEFLVMLTKKGRSPASLINKVVCRLFFMIFIKHFQYDGFDILKMNIEQFEEAKAILDERELAELNEAKEGKKSKH